MAVKNYKRQGRRSKVIVLSLVISMVAFISIFSFGQRLMKVSNNANPFHLYDIEMYINGNQVPEITKLLSTHDKVDDFYSISGDIPVKMKLDKKYLKIPNNNHVYNQKNR